MIPDRATLTTEYTLQYMGCVPAASRLAEIDRTIAAILANKARYEKVAMKLPNPPWFVIALIHMRESDLNFRCHLHNGDPLTARTHHVPAGRPSSGQPPFTWEESAWDALHFDHVDKEPFTSVMDICYALEAYNGWGYRDHHTPDPYLWAASNQYHSGKFIADGVFSVAASDQQLGCITVFKRMVERNVITAPGKAGEVGKVISGEVINAAEPPAATKNQAPGTKNA